MVYPIGWVIITIDVFSHEVTKSSSRWENMNQLEPRTEKSPNDHSEYPLVNIQKTMEHYHF